MHSHREEREERGSAGHIQAGGCCPGSCDRSLTDVFQIAADRQKSLPTISLHGLFEVFSVLSEMNVLKMIHTDTVLFAFLLC